MNHNDQRPRILMVGGGSGISNILRGLKRYPVDLTAVVTMFDSGGSSGVLREEFGYPPFGDLRQCLLALSDDGNDTQGLREALEFRFGSSTSLNGHSIGNLLLAALTSLRNDLEFAIDNISQMLRVEGQVIPVTLDRAELCAELEDGRVILGESDIDLRTASIPKIKRVFLSKVVRANPRAVEAVLEADAIVFGPGDLYTSILPNVLVGGMKDAIASSKANRIYVCNLMTKQGETDDFKASDFAREITRYLEPGDLNWAIVSTSRPSMETVRAYQKEGAALVEPDLDKVGKYVQGIIAASLGTDGLPLRHDPVRTASAIFQALGAGRVTTRQMDECSVISSVASE